MKFTKIISIFLILTLAISTLARVNRRRTSTKKRSAVSAKAPARVSETNTGLNDTNGGSIYYLDRHNAQCPNGAITFFQLIRSSDRVAYRLTCLNADSVNGGETTLYTPFNDTNGNNSVNFLDRHNVACQNSQVLSSFKIERNPSNSSQIRYRYTCKAANTICCNSNSTPKMDMGDGTIFYLDRQLVGNNNSPNLAMSQFRLRTSYNPDKMWYDFTSCKIADMDAINSVKNLEGVLQQSTQGVQTALQQLNAAKSATQALQQQLQSLQNQIAQSTNTVDGAQAAFDDANKKVTQDTVNLTQARANPALVC
jgi:hypothetical protein